MSTPQIFFTQIGWDSLGKARWKIFSSQNGLKRVVVGLGKARWIFFTGPFPGVLLKIEKFFACGAHYRGKPQDYALTGEPRPPNKHYPLHPTFVTFSNISRTAQYFSILLTQLYTRIFLRIFWDILEVPKAYTKKVSDFRANFKHR